MLKNFFFPPQNNQCKIVLLKNCKPIIIKSEAKQQHRGTVSFIFQPERHSTSLDSNNYVAITPQHYSYPQSLSSHFLIAVQTEHQQH